MHKKGIWTLVLVGILAACGAPPEAVEVPTLAALPTLTVTLTPPPATLTVTPSPTATLTITPSATVSFTPSATITDTPTPTASATPLPTDTPAPTADNEGLVALALLALEATVLPATFQAPAPAAAFPPVVTQALATQPVSQAVTCPILPAGGFGLIFTADPTLAAQIGCPAGQPPVTASVNSAYQNFERGAMMWLQGSPSSIYVLYSDGRFQRFDDTYNAATDPISGGETPPPGLVEPGRGFGKVWRSSPEVRSGLGWARDGEAGGTATVQVFERGQMIDLLQRTDVIILSNAAGTPGGTWRAVAGSF